MASSTVKKSRPPELHLTSAYKKVPMSSLKVTDLDFMFQGISSSYNKYIIAISYTNMQLHPAYHEEQMRYLRLDYHDINSAREIIKTGLKVEQKRCLAAIQSYSELQGSATFSPPRADLLHEVTKLKCAYTSFLISQWAEREDIDKFIPGIKDIYSKDIGILEKEQKPGDTPGRNSAQNPQPLLLAGPGPPQEKVAPATSDTPPSGTTSLEVDLSKINKTPLATFQGFDKLTPELTLRAALRTTGGGSGRPIESMPEAVLLHGLPGVGKMSYVYSFASEYSLPLWVLSAKIYGPAMAESARDLDAVVDKHHDSSSLPAVLAIEDADLFLCDPKPQDSRLLVFQTILNKTWDRIEANNISVFIFAITSNPEKLSEVYTRHRLTQSVHVTVPDSVVRRDLFREYLQEYAHTVSLAQYLDLMRESQGHTASNLKKILKSVQDDLTAELYLQAESFSWITYGGSDILVPDSDGDVKGPLASLTQEEQSKTRIRAITLEMLVEKLKSWESRTFDAGRELEHAVWQAGFGKVK